MTHTPGPWRTHAWGDLPNSPDVNYEILSGDDTALASIDLAFDDDTGDPKVEADEMAANARLIAAAPELLAVLTWCADRWDKYDEDDAPELGQAIRDAIAKAEGRE
jgi:hypothetical protein